MSDQMVTEQVMEPVNKFYQVYNDRDLSLWEEALAPTYVGHVNGQTIPNREVGKGFVQGFLQGFPDVHYSLDDTIVSADKVVTRWSATGTHTGDFFGMPPTNKRIATSGITIFRVANGQIAELHDVWDQAGLMAQLKG